MLSFLEMIQIAKDAGASDIFIVPGQPPSYKKGKCICRMSEERVLPDISKQFLEEAYALAQRDMTRFLETGDDDFSISISNLARLRISAYKQRGSFAAVFRIVSFGIPDYRALGIPESIMQLAETKKGMVLVTGAAGNGKSTTLACIVDRINHTRSGHIITLEDPIEYIHRHDRSIVSQREVGIDTEDYIFALRASLRQAPDVILLGEMRDHETIRIAMTGAETGHLILSSLHTVGAVNTIDRIIDVFPPNQQQQIRIQLASLLQTVVSQQLVPTVDGELTLAFEIMHMNPAIRNMIRESKVHQIETVLGMSASEGMVSMDNSLLKLYEEGRISKDTALQYALHPETLQKRLQK